MKRVCVFCGSSPGGNPAYGAAAEAMGAAIAKAGLGLVYGGASVGLMGWVADAVLAAGGEVVGVIPRSLSRKEIAHQGLSELHVVDSLHERKAKMVELASAFAALPGGLGTFEELLEIMTWSQLGMHDKPIGVLDVRDYFAPLMSMLDHAVAESFIRRDHRRMLLRATSPEELLQAFEDFRPGTAEHWLDDSQT